VPVIREIESQGYRVRLDLSAQVLTLAIPETDREQVFSVAEAVKAGRLVRGKPEVEEEILPTPLTAVGKGLVPAGVLVQKAKQFDDGLYAAVELAAQQGAGAFAGKASLLRRLVAELTGQPDMEGPLALLVAAARQGGLAVDTSPGVEATVAALTASFLADEKRSKPLGFFTWSKELEAIFRQDRLLQTPLKNVADTAGVRALAEALRADPAQRATYEAYASLLSRLTNPLVAPDLRPLLSTPASPPDPRIALFPPSVSHEGELIKKVHGDAPLPEGFSLIDEVIRRIRSGELDLTPTPQSGWYDYQTWSHEPMVIPERMPEAPHLAPNEGYRRELQELFKAAQALARETHVKQLEIPMRASALGGRPTKQPVYLVVSPDLGVQPLPSYYLRRALGYDLVRSTLEQTFGAEGLAAMRRVGPDGPSKATLASELDDTQSLFWGAHETACREIGLAVEAPAPRGRHQDHAAHFAAWAQALAADPDIGRDARMMVPVFFDRQREKLKVWVFLGWVTRELNVAFQKPPAAEVFDGRGRRVEPSDDLRLVFASERHTLACPLTAEVYVSRLLDRYEFRRHCDLHKTRSAILANLA
jgi:hypothetical protein